MNYASHQEVNIAVKFGPKPNPKRFPRDNKGKRFPLNIFKQTLQNGDDSVRDWLVWSEARESLFCFPCRLFKSSSTNVGASALCSVAGWSKEKGWRKLYDRVPEHEHRVFHRQHYLEWHTAERRLLIGSGIDTHIEKEIRSEVEKWREILKRIIDVILFLGERGLTFRGSSQRIGSVNNGNFLGIIELISHYDPILREHVKKVAESQTSGHRLSAHYICLLIHRMNS